MDTSGVRVHKPRSRPQIRAAFVALLAALVGLGVVLVDASPATANGPWIAQTPAEANNWTAVTYGAGQFVAVNWKGTHQVMTSPDGITWTPRTAAANNTWSSITYGGGQFVAVADWEGEHQVMTSPDGITWTPHAAAEGNRWVSVTYGDGQFVAVAGNGTHRVMTSPDGITWTPQAAAEDNSWSSVTYGGGQFVAVGAFGKHLVMTSPDGITWTPRTAAQTNYWTSVAYGGGQFVAVAAWGESGGETRQVMTSPDGITWTQRSAAQVNNETNSWWSVTYGAGRFVAVATAGSGKHPVMTSRDGITWTPQTAPNAAGWRSSWVSVTYGAGQFLAVGATGKYQVMTSLAAAPGPLEFSSGAFGKATVGVHARLTVTVANTGTLTATPSAINVVGSGVEVTGGTCRKGRAIPAASSCTVALSWTPTRAGTLTGAALTVAYPAGMQPVDRRSLTGIAARAVTPCSLQVQASPPNRILARTGTTQVVRTATVSPGCSLAITTRATGAARGDLRYATFSVDHRTGAVSVTTLGIPGVQVQVRITAAPTSTRHTPVTWARTWHSN